jgi:hypothetical protein
MGLVSCGTILATKPEKMRSRLRRRIPQKRKLM